MLYRIRHETAYQYSQAVTLGRSVAHLKPRVCERQVCHQGEIIITPESDAVTEELDYFGNPVLHFSLQQPHQVMTIASDHTVEVLLESGDPPSGGLPWQQVVERVTQDHSEAGLDAYQYAFDSTHAGSTEMVKDYTLASFTAGRPIFEATADLMSRIHTDFQFDPASTTIATPVTEVFTNRRGVCQDFAHLMIACLRTLRLPTRYVSGYIETIPPPGQERLVGADASHAWVGVYCPETGWYDFDPTNDTTAGGRHVTVAWGRDFADVSPVKGLVLGGGGHTVSVSVDVEPMMEREPEPGLFG